MNSYEHFHEYPLVQMVLCDRNSIAPLPPQRLYAGIIDLLQQSVVFVANKALVLHVCAIGWVHLFTCMLISHLFFCNAGILRSINMNMQ